MIFFIALRPIKLSATCKELNITTCIESAFAEIFPSLKWDLAYVYHVSLCEMPLLGMCKIRSQSVEIPLLFMWLSHEVNSFWATVVHFKSATGQNVLWKILMTRLLSQRRAHCLHNYLNDSDTKSAFARIIQMVLNSLDNCSPLYLILMM